MEKKRNCPVSATLDLIGGKYKALILWHLTDNVMRFSHLRKLVPGATAKMLTQQLREMESDGLLVRTVYAVVPPKVEYTLTEKGNSLHAVLEEMFRWGSDLLKESGKAPDCSMVTNVTDCHCRSCKEIG
jgi:DNA-binding HxlR family transcriptional regulator